MGTVKKTTVALPRKSDLKAFVYFCGTGKLCDWELFLGSTNNGQRNRVL